MLILLEQFILLSLTLTDEKPLEEVHADVVAILGKLILAGSGDSFNCCFGDSFGPGNFLFHCQFVMVILLQLLTTRK